jgi:hypothetical protein
MSARIAFVSLVELELELLFLNWMSGRVSECEDTPFMGEFAEPTSLHDAE